VHINLPGVVHNYAKGHQVELVISTTDPAFTGSRANHLLSLSVDPNGPAVLRFPVGEGAAAGADRPAAAGNTNHGGGGSTSAHAAVAAPAAAAPSHDGPGRAAAPRQTASVNGRLVRASGNPAPVGLVAAGLALVLAGSLMRRRLRRG
jgi:hypothetical protein